MSEETVLPAGYRLDSYGRRVLESKMHPLDVLRDDTVCGVIQRALGLQELMRAFKVQAMADILTFCQISAEQHGWTWGGRKGNLTLTSFDGGYRLQVAVADHVSFDERLHIAKQMIDECITSWAADSNDNIKALIENAFQTDQAGKISTSRIFGLMRVKIDDALWLRAMEALKDSVQITATSQYLRLYRRVGKTDKYEQISMDIAGL